MVLYHGSIEIVNNPEIRGGITFLDFGVGFYTTSSFEQAQRWAKIKMRRSNLEKGYVSVYEFDFEKAVQELRVKRFPTADFEWFEFVVNNRKGIESDVFADLYIGPVADDNVYQSIRLFETGAYDAEYTVKRLKTEVLHDQWTFHTTEILQYLKFIEAKEIV